MSLFEFPLPRTMDACLLSMVPNCGAELSSYTGSPGFCLSLFRSIFTKSIGLMATHTPGLHMPEPVDHSLILLSSWAASFNATAVSLRCHAKEREKATLPLGGCIRPTVQRRPQSARPFAQSPGTGPGPGRRRGRSDERDSRISSSAMGSLLLS